MKKLLIGLLAFTLMLGVGCKKEELTEKKVKIEVKKAEEPVIGELAPDIITKNPFGLDGAYTKEYMDFHPWQINYPNGWPAIHGPHGYCLGTAYKSLGPGFGYYYWNVQLPPPN